VVKRFLVGYLMIGAIVSTWINVEGAMISGETAFDWGPSLSATLAHFVIAFGTPMLAWPAIVFTQLFRALDMVYSSVLRNLPI